MAHKGKVWKFGANIDTDAILPAFYLNLTDPGKLALHCFETNNPDFCLNSHEGDFIVADANFGCGSSREHAPMAIKAKGIHCIIAASFARIFFRNAFNVGLPVIESLEAAEKIGAGHEISVNIKKGEIRNFTTRETYRCEPLPDNMLSVLQDGGLIPHLLAKKNTQ
ncbi:MAG: 3-isopropylmalate dehydratase small subunit [Calditrichaeota bacterium]|nr:3-isopropylmalate dehydratase small subunit [Calditrichota bacterium]